MKLALVAACYTYLAELFVCFSTMEPFSCFFERLWAVAGVEKLCTNGVPLSCEASLDACRALSLKKPFVLVPNAGVSTSFFLALALFSAGVP